MTIMRELFGLTSLWSRGLAIKPQAKRGYEIAGYFLSGEFAGLEPDPRPVECSEQLKPKQYGRDTVWKQQGCNQLTIDVFIAVI
jgi:hypothetical protein